MEGENQIDQLKKIFNGADSVEVKRTLEMLIRKMDAIELNLEKKMDKKFEDQKHLIESLFKRLHHPERLPPEEPWFYS